MATTVIVLEDSSGIDAAQMKGILMSNLVSFSDCKIVTDDKSRDYDTFPTREDLLKFSEMLSTCHTLLDEQRHRDVGRSDELTEMAYTTLAISNALCNVNNNRIQSIESAKNFYGYYIDAYNRRHQREEDLADYCRLKKD